MNSTALKLLINLLILSFKLVFKVFGTDANLHADEMHFNDIVKFADV